MSTPSNHRLRNMTVQVAALIFCLLGAVQALAQVGPEATTNARELIEQSQKEEELIQEKSQTDPLGNRGMSTPMSSMLGLREALRAQQLLSDQFGVGSDVWSVTSWSELAREAAREERWGLTTRPRAEFEEITDQLINPLRPVKRKKPRIRIEAEVIAEKPDAAVAFATNYLESRRQ